MMLASAINVPEEWLGRAPTGPMPMLPQGQMQLETGPQHQALRMQH